MEKDTFFWGGGEWRKRDGKENWEAIKTQVLKHSPKGKRKGSKEDVRRGVAAGGTVRRSKGVRGIAGMKVGEDPIENFFPMRV